MYSATTIVVYQRRAWPRLHHAAASQRPLGASRRGAVTVAEGPWRLTERGASAAAERALRRKLRTAR